MHSKLTHPGTEDCLSNPRHVSRTIKIVRDFSPRSIQAVLFDYDGTLSNERLGWPNLMIATNTAFLVAAADGKIAPEDAEKLVIQEIESTIGIPTYLQMKNLNALIETKYHASIDPFIMKKVYTNCLNAMVERRYREAENTPGAIESLLIPGSRELLNSLKQRVGKKLYLASGTDIEAITNSVKTLALEQYFPASRIRAAGSGELGPEDCAKEYIIKNLLSEKKIPGEKLLTFGDGFPELLNTYHAGGLAVGVVTPDNSNYEQRGFFSVKKKEQRLINAGAHVIVTDPYKEPEALLDIFLTA